MSCYKALLQLVQVDGQTFVWSQLFQPGTKLSAGTFELARLHVNIQWWSYHVTAKEKITPNQSYKQGGVSKRVPFDLFDLKKAKSVACRAQSNIYRDTKYLTV